MDADTLNTFSKKEATELCAKHGHKILEEKEVCVRGITEVITEQFSGMGLDFLSLDAEGMDVDLLMSLDFENIRPKVICIETQVHCGFKYDGFSDLTAFMLDKGYVIFADTVTNTIFVDKQAVARKAAREKTDKQ